MTEEQQRKKDNFWRNMVLAFVFMTALGTTYMAFPAQPLLMPLYYVGTLIMLLEYIHYRYFDELKELVKR